MIAEKQLHLNHGGYLSNIQNTCNLIPGHFAIMRYCFHLAFRKRVRLTPFTTTTCDRVIYYQYISYYQLNKLQSSAETEQRLVFQSYNRMIPPVD